MVCCCVATTVYHRPCDYTSPLTYQQATGAFVMPFFAVLGRGFGRELLLRYQDKEERAPAALRLRGAGGGSPQISSPRQRAHRWLQGPRQARASAREGRRGAKPRVRPVI